MAELVELGSGTAAKTRVLLDAMRPRPGRCGATCRSTSPSRSCATASTALADEYPALEHPRHRRRLRAPPAARSRRPSRGRPRVRRLPRRHDRQLPARRRAGASCARSPRLPRARRLPAARHRPRQGPRRARGRLRRRGRRHRRVQPQRPARHQPRARRRLPDRAVRARRVLRPRARVDRDAPARAPRLPRARSPALDLEVVVRARRGDAHRDLGQVHAARGWRPTTRPAGLELDRVAHRRRRTASPSRSPAPSSLPAWRGRRRPPDRLPGAPARRARRTPPTARRSARSTACSTTRASTSSTGS